MGTLLRPASRRDIPGMARVRASVRENRLASREIGEAEYRAAIEDTGQGWVITAGDDVVAFAVCNLQDGNVWALFVDPAHEGRGLGRRLLATLVACAWEQGLPGLWLTTEPGTRAEAFYLEAGWQVEGQEPSGELRMGLQAP